jgi:hypothetical protein
MPLTDTGNWVYAAVPKHQAQALRKDALGRATSLTKNVLQQYIATFLHSEGSNRNLMLFVAPAVESYITDRSLPPGLSIHERYVHLARYFNEVPQKLPAILIADSGFTDHPTGIGDIDMAYYDESLETHVLRIAMLMTVQVEIFIISGDEETTETLRTAVTLMLGPQLRRLGGGNEICDRNGMWVVRLAPKGDLSVSGSATNVTTDQVDQLWVSTISHEIEYEGVHYLAYDAAHGSAADLARLSGYVTDTANPDEETTWATIITAPTTMRIGAIEAFAITNEQPFIKMHTTNADVLRVDQKGRSLYAISPGTADLVIAHVDGSELARATVQVA